MRVLAVCGVVLCFGLWPDEHVYLSYGVAVRCGVGAAVCCALGAFRLGVQADFPDTEGGEEKGDEDEAGELRYGVCASVHGTARCILAVGLIVVWQVGVADAAAEEDAEVWRCRFHYFVLLASRA